MTTTLLPDSRCTTVLTPRGATKHGGIETVPVFCANCGKPAGVLQAECVAEQFASFFILCDPCGERLGELAGTMRLPGDVFKARVAEVLATEYATPLTLMDVERELADPSSPLAKLARDRSHPSRFGG